MHNVNKLEIVRMAQKVGWDHGWEMSTEQLFEFANLVANAAAKREREVCIEICNYYANLNKDRNNYAERCIWGIELRDDPRNDM